MLEPWAASVFNSVLSARPFLVNHPNSLGMLTRHTGNSLSHDFFTPYPRRSKGEERASDVQCAERFTSNVRVKCMMDTEVSVSSSTLRGDIVRNRSRRHPGSRSFSDSARTRLPAIHTWIRRNDVLQRRHVSSRSDPPRISTGTLELEDLQKQIYHVVNSTGKGRDTREMEAAWNAYEGLRAAHDRVPMTVRELLTLGSMIADHTLQEHRPPDLSKFWTLWGSRLLTLLDDLDTRIDRISLDASRQIWNSLMARALALSGQLDEAITIARRMNDVPISSEERIIVVNMYHNLLRCMHQYRSALAVLEFIIEEWKALGTYLLDNSSVWRDKWAYSVRSFQRRAYNIVACVENPIAFMLRVQDVWTEDQRQCAGEFLLRVLCAKDLADDALGVSEEMNRQGLLVPWLLRLSLIKALAKADSFALANTMFTALSKELDGGNWYWQQQEVGLFLAAQQGDVLRAHEYFHKLQNAGGGSVVHIQQLLHSHAVRGDPSRVVELFHQFFPNEPGARRPNIVHYTAVIYAYSNAGDYSGMNLWLGRMVKGGCTPDAHVYNIILQCFAKRGDVASVGAILDQMLASRIPPSHFAYTTVISLLARRKDSAAAEAIYQRAMKQGVVPDRRMISSLMNAHVESGSWKGVILAFDYLKSLARGRGIGISIEVYNTLLKAYVLIGAPYYVVHSLFNRLSEVGVRPDAYTYALLIQSACDAGLLRVAGRIFADMERLSEKWENSIHINVYILTILMAGYLRVGLKDRARDVYDDMLRRGIQPSSITYHSILRAYGNERSQASVEIAEKFLKNLMAAEPGNKQWLNSNRGIRSALDHVYGPLLTAYNRLNKPHEVERLLQELFDMGGEPTLGNMTALLDAHRRTKNIQGAKQVWAEIHELALKESEVAALFEKDEQVPRRRGNLLTIPLSIYIDALSSEGLHLEVPEIWRTVRLEGFTFDSHNWNHLAVALVRAGEPERAFEVVERVILPYRRLLRRASHKRHAHLDSPLIAALPPLKEGVLDRPPSEPPMRNEKRSHKTGLLMARRLAYGPTLRKQDFAHPLHILYQFSPAWDAWRPHGLLLTLLRQVLRHLRHGNLIQSLQSAEDREFDRAVATVEELEQRSMQAQEMLERIQTQYPETMELLQLYDRYRNTPRARKFRDVTL